MKTLSLLSSDKQHNGENLTCCYGWLKSMWGDAFIVFNNLGLIYIGFPQNNIATDIISELQVQWPLAQWQAITAIPQPYSNVFTNSNNVTLVLKGTTFQLSVWQALLEIPTGAVSTYSEIAKKINRPKAWRAVGSAVGKNPISYLVPCHRVLPASGGYGQYLWGQELKKQLLISEGIK